MININWLNLIYIIFKYILITFYFNLFFKLSVFNFIFIIFIIEYICKIKWIQMLLLVNIQLLFYIFIGSLFGLVYKNKY